MDLSLTSEQQDLRENLASFFANESPSEVVRAAEPNGFDRELWEKVVDLGLSSMLISQHRGGGGASILDVSIVAEEFGRRIAPIPLIEASAAMILLNQLVTMGVRGATDLLAASVDDYAIVSVALHPLEAGVARLAPAGAIADAVLALDGDDLVVLRSKTLRRYPLRVPDNLGCSPVADRGAGVDERFVLASGPAATSSYAYAVRVWQTLMAAALVGLAQSALDLGLDYVQHRHAFGTPVSSFQTVQHRLADSVTELDGARLLAQEAAWSAGENAKAFPSLSAMAFVFASQTAQKIAAESLHFHGGYGYTLDYDIQLFFRRAKAWPLAHGDPRLMYQEVAAQLFERAGA